MLSLSIFPRVIYVYSTNAHTQSFVSLCMMHCIQKGPHKHMKHKHIYSRICGRNKKDIRHWVFKLSVHYICTCFMCVGWLFFVYSASFRETLQFQAHTNFVHRGMQPQPYRRNTGAKTFSSQQRGSSYISILCVHTKK